MESHKLHIPRHFGAFECDERPVRLLVVYNQVCDLTLQKLKLCEQKNARVILCLKLMPSHLILKGSRFVFSLRILIASTFVHKIFISLLSISEYQLKEKNKFHLSTKAFSFTERTPPCWIKSSRKQQCHKRLDFKSAPKPKSFDDSVLLKKNYKTPEKRVKSTLSSQF